MSDLSALQTITNVETPAGSGQGRMPEARIAINLWHTHDQMTTCVPAEGAGQTGDRRTEEIPSISTIAQSCTELFSEYTSSSSSSSSLHTKVDLQHQRFYVWASYLGVFTSFNASLDKRLEYSNEIRSLVVQMLSVLQRNLAFLVSADHDVSVDNTITSTSGLEGTPSQALEAIELSINRLNRLGAAIRKHSVSSLDERINAFTQRYGDNGYTQLARHIIQFRYKTATASLQEHLALSMASRRQRLRYLHRHQSKLAGHINITSSERTAEKDHAHFPPATKGEIDRREERQGPFQPAPASVLAFRRHHLEHSPMLGERSETNASKLASTPSFIARIRRGDSDSVVSSSNESRTFMPAALEDYPEPPKCKPHQPEPSCPYCCRPLEQHERQGRAWMRHVNKDLCPFICLSEKCRQGPSSFQEFGTWAQHMRHSHTTKWPQQIHKPFIWACDIDHEVEEFSDKDQFQQHLASKHSDCTDEEKHAIAESCMVLRKRGRNICPICGYDVSNTGNLDPSSQVQRGMKGSTVGELTQLELMEKHVAGHLRRLALDSSRDLEDRPNGMSETSLVTSEPNLIDRDSKIRCPSGADLLDDTPFEFTEIEGGSGGSSQQILNRYDLQWSSSEFEALLKLPKELSNLAAEEWSSKQEEISKATYTTPNTATSDPILMHLRSRQAPESRDGFQIAIACALSLEYDAVCRLVDDFWDKDYGRTASDPNMYRNGRIGVFNIVIVLLSGKRISKAISATASLRSSYPNLELVLVTGICGGVPKTGTGKELVLGDVVISHTVVQYDLGRRYPDGLETKNTLNDSLGRPALHIQNLAVTFKTRRGLQLLEQQAASHLEKLQSQQSDGYEATHYEYPGAGNDHLYPTSYLHKHYSTDVCRECNSDPDVVCAVSRTLSCRELGCDAQKRVPRKRLQDRERLRVPRILVGHLGWGDRVVKSGEDRDRIAKEHDLIAFGKEEAGAWDEIPCIIVQGICDYADSHKNKNWQNFAAATAASVAKALVEEYPRTDNPSNSSHTLDRTMERVSNTNLRVPSSDACRIIAYDRNENFIPRPDINSKLDRVLPFNSDEFHSAALWGLGGSGKTQIALQYAYGRCRDPDCSVFWVHADTEATFKQDYKTISGVLGLESRLEESELLEEVRRGIESQKRWVLVVDNADDLGLFGVGQASGEQQGTMLGLIPRGPNGTVLWTSRDQRIDGSLVGPQRGIQVAKMTVKESRKLLEKLRRQVTPSEEVQEVEFLLGELQWLSLAISQAGAYLYRTDTSVSEYLSQLKRETGRWRILGEDEFDRHRRGDAQNSVLRTWAISIRRLKQDSQTAGRIIHVLAFVDNQNIPVELLVAAAEETKQWQKEQTLKSVVRRLKDFSLLSTSPSPEEQAKKDDTDELGRAVRRLKDFSFMTEHRGEGNGRTFEMHKLVQDAARYGLKTQQSSGQDEGYFAKVALCVMDNVYPQDTSYNSKTQGDCERYLTHALQVCGWAEIYGMEKEAHNLQVRICRFLYSRGRWKEHRLARETQLRLAQTAFGKKHQKSIDAMLLLGWAFSLVDRPQEAEECANKAVMLAQETPGDKVELTLRCKYLLAATHRRADLSEQAKQLLMETLDDARQFLDEDHDLILDCMDQLARAHMDLKEYDEADELLPRLLKLRQDKYGQTHPTTLTLLDLFGHLHYYQGRHDDEAKLRSHLLDLQRQSLGNEHPNTTTMMFNLAGSKRLRGRKEEAVELMQECSRLRHKVLGANHPGTKFADKMLEIWEREDRGLNW